MGGLEDKKGREASREAAARPGKTEVRALSLPATLSLLVLSLSSLELGILAMDC